MPHLKSNISSLHCYFNFRFRIIPDRIDDSEHSRQNLRLCYVRRKRVGKFLLQAAQASLTIASIS